MSKDWIWYVTMTIVICAAVAGAVAMVGGHQRLAIACVHARGNMVDGKCVIGGGR